MGGKMHEQFSGYFQRNDLRFVYQNGDPNHWEQTLTPEA
jgi:hypothetical protein